MFSGLLDFRKSGDQDGFIGDFSAKTKVTTEIYQLKVRTVPGDALFEASIVHDLTKNTFHTKVSSKLPRLRKVYKYFTRFATFLFCRADLRCQ